MKIDLANVAGVPGAHGRYVIHENLGSIDGIEVIGPVTGELTVQNIGHLLAVRGRVQATVEMTCVRCITHTRELVAFDLEEEFASEGARPEVGTIDIEDPEESAIQDFVLDVTELVRQQIETHVPMRSLCRPDCQGLCPHCGKNLNEGPCECVPDTDTGPFSQLKELLDETPDQPV